MRQTVPPSACLGEEDTAALVDGLSIGDVDDRTASSAQLLRHAKRGVRFDGERHPGRRDVRRGRRSRRGVRRLPVVLQRNQVGVSGVENEWLPEL